MGVFAAMAGGSVWGFFFFLFLSLAALTTVVAVFECLVGGLVDELGIGRRTAALSVGCAVAALSLPCVFVDGALEIEDFVFSKFWLPLGGLALSIFVSWRIGWGWEAFRAEASAGRGAALPDWFRPVFRYVVPAIIVVIVAGGLAI